MRKATNPSYKCGSRMLQQLMLTNKKRTSLAWPCLTRLILTYGSDEEVSEPLWSWVTNHFSKRWEPCAQQLPFCMTLALKRHTESRAPPSVLVLERSFLSLSLWQTDVRVNSSLPVWTLPPSISRATPRHKDPQRDISPHPTLGETTSYFKWTALKDLRQEGHIFFCELWSRGKGGALTALQKWPLSHVKSNQSGQRVTKTVRYSQEGLKAASAAASRNLCLGEGSHTLTHFPMALGRRALL